MEGGLWRINETEAVAEHAAVLVMAAEAVAENDEWRTTLTKTTVHGDSCRNQRQSRETPWS